MRDPDLRAPQQERSRASLERVLAAGIEVLDEVGYEGFTIAEVSRRAHVSIGAIYGRFASKDTLFQVIHARELDRIASEYEHFSDSSRWAELGMAELIATMVIEVGTIFRRNATLLRISLGRAMVDEVVRERRARLGADLADRWQGLLLARGNEIVHPEPAIAAQMSFAISYAAFMRWLTFEFADEWPGADWEHTLGELASICTSYLVGDAARDTIAPLTGL